MGFRGRKAAAGAGGSVAGHQESLTLTGPGVVTQSLTYLPLPETEIVAWNGLEQPPGDYTIGYGSGLVTYPTPTGGGFDAGDVVTIQYLYDPDVQHYVALRDLLLALGPTFAYWMDDASATNAHDWTGHGNDGVYSGLPHNLSPGLLRADGSLGKVARLDGAFPRYLDLNVGTVHLTAPSTWSYVQLIRPGAGAPGDQAVFSGLGSIAANHNFAAGLTADNKPKLTCYGVSANTAQSPTALAPGVPAMLGFTFGLDSVSRVYVNGTEVASSNNVGIATGQGLAIGGSPLAGRESVADLGECAGWLGSTLSAAQHRALFNAWSHNL